MILSPEFNQQTTDGKFFYHFTTDIGLRVMKGEDPAAIVSSMGDKVAAEDKTTLLKALKDFAAKGPGLQPANFFVQGPRALIKGLPRKGRQKVVEGLLEPAPQSWIDASDLPIKGENFYQYFIDALTSGEANIVKKYATEYKLLKIAIKPEDDIKIADIAALIKYTTPYVQAMDEETDKNKLASLQFHMAAAIRKGAKGYWKSLAPVSKKNESALKLPVVIDWTPIEPARLEVVQTFSCQEIAQLKTLRQTAKGQNKLHTQKVYG